jgi:putative ABC transport system substrate-binding protein
MILLAERGANMRRREFLGVLGSAAAAWPAVARAQQASPVRRIGILMGGAEGDSQSEAGLAALTTALRQLGWTDGQNIRIDIRWASGNVERMKAFAKELVGLPSDLLVAHTTQPVAALQRETKTIPIVFLIVSDPVGSGFVARPSEPGWQHHGIHQHRVILGRQVDRSAQGDRTKHHPRGAHV